MNNHPHQKANVETVGEPISSATSAMILLHGRGATASGILDLARVLTKDGMIYLAPQAANNAWYPYRFIAPVSQNEPYLSSALALIEAQLSALSEAGLSSQQIILAGFSQGACLACEYVARHPKRYGGLIAFSGGLIGAPGELPAYSGSLKSTPVFIGCSDVDAHIPLERIEQSAAIFDKLGADVTQRIYPGMGHTINTDEIREAQRIVVDLVI